MHFKLESREISFVHDYTNLSKRLQILQRALSGRLWTNEIGV